MHVRFLLPALAILAATAVAGPPEVRGAVAPQQQAAEPSAPDQPPVAATSAPAGSDGYTYDPDNRRDPFLSLLGSGPEVRETTGRVEGPPSMTVAEITVRGVIQSGEALAALIQGPDNRTYIVRDGDRLLDGTIKAVTPTGLVIIQEVNDPLSLVKQREVRKLLRSLEDAQ